MRTKQSVVQESIDLQSSGKKSKLDVHKSISRIIEETLTQNAASFADVLHCFNRFPVPREAGSIGICAHT